MQDGRTHIYLSKSQKADLLSLVIDYLRHVLNDEEMEAFDLAATLFIKAFVQAKLQTHPVNYKYYDSYLDDLEEEIDREWEKRHEKIIQESALAR